MSIDNVISQLKTLQAFCIDNDDKSGVWRDDAKALETAIELLQKHSQIDTAAYYMMQHHLSNMIGTEKIGKYTVCHHGDRLYSVHSVDSAVVHLVYADNPHKAAMKIHERYE